MQAQDATATVILKVWPWIDANKNKLIGAAGIVAIAVFIFSFFSWRHGQTRITAGQALTKAVISVSPNANPGQVAADYLKIAADYPGTSAGQRAWLQGAAALFAAEQFVPAQAEFQKFLDAHPDGEFSAQAALGVAKCLDAQGKVNEAAGAYQKVVSGFSDAQSVNAAKFALAQIDEEQGRIADAEELYQDIARFDPYGPLGSDAAQRALELRSKSSSSSPTVPASSFNLSH
jgi:predicted negative regulator of RcsB-dependent stress response